MAEVKKAAAEKTAAKPAAVQAADTKKEEVKEVQEVKEVKEAPKAEKKKPGRKPAAKKAAEKKTTVKKTAAKETPVKETTAKTAGRKPAVKATVEIQFAGNTHTPEELVQSVKDIWEYDLHRAPADFKTVELYVKPEDGKVYYVINNGEVSDSFNF